MTIVCVNIKAELEVVTVSNRGWFIQVRSKKRRVSYRSIARRKFLVLGEL